MREDTTEGLYNGEPPEYVLPTDMKYTKTLAEFLSSSRQRPESRKRISTGRQKILHKMYIRRLGYQPGVRGATEVRAGVSVTAEIHAPGEIVTTEVQAPGFEAPWRFAHLGY